MPLPSRDELQALLDERRTKLEREEPSPTNCEYTRHKANVEWAEEALQVLAEDRQETRQVLTLQAFRIGDAALFGIPGETIDRWIKTHRYVTGREMVEAGLAELVRLAPMPELFATSGEESPPKSHAARNPARARR